MDLFAKALVRFYETGRARLHIERDDGYRDTEDVGWYLTTYRDFPRHEKQALKFARGRVLDVGCGAGRHSLYLQRLGLAVTGIDTSPETVELARGRGVKDVRVADACRKLPFRGGEFDTVVLLGNNLGISGTVDRFQRMLRELYRITNPGGRILGTTRLPSTTNPMHRRYLRRNLELGRAIGQIRLRLVFNGKRGAWFDLLLLSPTDLMQIAAREKWEIVHVFPLRNFEEGYSVVLEKEGRQDSRTR
jgi:SAM-dependent methyltransferase